MERRRYIDNARRASKVGIRPYMGKAKFAKARSRQIILKPNEAICGR